MALLIADEAARSDIEQFGRPDYSVQREKGHTDWYFIGAGEAEDAYEASALIRAAKYLTLRDKLETDPADIQRVRIKA